MKQKPRHRTHINCDIDVSSNTEDPEPPSMQMIQQWSETCLNHLLCLNHQSLIHIDSASVSVYITDQEEARHYNKTYRNKDYATNVLSFISETPPLTIFEKHKLLGDILCCAPIIRQEAKAQNKRLIHHWAHMIIHSLLHLCGFDHQSDNDAKHMEQLEIELLEKLNMPDPYANATASSPTHPESTQQTKSFNDELITS